VLDDYCEVGHRCWRPREALSFASSPVRFTIVDQPTHLAGRTLDVITEAGALYDERVFADSQRYLLEEDATATLELREFVVTLPPLKEVLEKVHSPVDVLERWMKRGGDASSALLQGQAWLELRPQLAMAIYRTRTDYSDWADDKLRRLAAAHADRLLALYAEVEEPAERDRLREALIERDTPAGSRSAHLAISEWLSDIPARDLVLQLETRVANRIRTLPKAEGKLRRERLERFWQSLVARFGAPTRQRVVTLLFPVYDVDRDVVGFHRVLLPRPRPDGPPVDPVPPYPFGSRILGKLWENREVGPQLAAVEVAAIEFRPVLLTGGRNSSDDRSDDRADHGSPGAPAHGSYESVLRFATEEGEVVTLSTILLRNPGNKFEARCMKLGNSAGESRTAGLLREFLRSSQEECERGLRIIPLDEE
jgi:hypothetical protein